MLACFQSQDADVLASKGERLFPKHGTVNFLKNANKETCKTISDAGRNPLVVATKKWTMARKGHTSRV